MLNNENIWNGLTYAFWLIYQDNHSWNNRRSSKSGYIDKGDESSNPVRKPDNFYSEIDIELSKLRNIGLNNIIIKMLNKIKNSKMRH